MRLWFQFLSQILNKAGVIHFDEVCFLLRFGDYDLSAVSWNQESIPVKESLRSSFFRLPAIYYLNTDNDMIRKYYGS